MRITGGKFKNHKLSSPKGKLTRPTLEKLRQTVFNICQYQVEEARFLDVFAGSGAMGIEALSRGAIHATFIERNRAALSAIKENLRRLELLEKATILPGDALIQLKKLGEAGATFDLIFVDPPYGETLKGSQQTYLDATLSCIDQNALLSKTGVLFIEETSLPSVPLHHLTLEKKREAGKTHLLQYVPRSAPFEGCKAD